MNPIGELSKIAVDKGAIRDDQVEMIRTKINQVVAGVNRTGFLAESTAIRAISGEERGAPTSPRGRTRHTFTNASTAEEIPHGLGKVPDGYIVVRRYPLGTVADAALADWNQKTAWLQTDTAGLTVTILWF